MRGPVSRRPPRAHKSLATRPLLQQKLHCDVTDENYIAGLVMYGSYAVLFILFALKRFAAPAKKKSAGAKKTA